MTGSERAFDCFYSLDAEDRIVDWGGPQWRRIAVENGGALAVADLRGDRIYDHVVGHFTQRFMREFFALARATGTPQLRAYRCDSPSAKRLMEMCAQSEGAGGLRVEHRLVAEAPTAVEVGFRQAVSSTPAPYRRCSICNRICRKGAAEWREADSLSPEPARLDVVHTVCPECRRGLSARLPQRPTAPA